MAATSFHRLLLQALLLKTAVSVHYTCQTDEVNGEVQGETGVVCGPRCGVSAYECPLDMPEGTTAQPQCMLQDVDMSYYCGLLCQTDSSCPSGADCRKVGSPEVGLCVHSLSFNEWAKQGVRRKLAIGWPSGGSGQSTRGFQIAKAYAALQSLKKRYGMLDGDADVLVVKEMLSTASTASYNPAAAVPAAQGWNIPAMAAPGLPAAATSAAASSGWFFSAASPSPPPPVAQVRESGWMKDIHKFEGYMADGIPGIEREAHDIMWNIEHSDRYGVCTDQLRCAILIACAYLGIGGAYKYQMMGARGMDMVPHVGFWQEYPGLVIDGLRYTQVLLGGALPSASGNFNGFQQMGKGDRDTFAHFEPSR